MKFVIFGLTISSSWGNGHATLLRGLFRALVRRGHEITFFEREVPYYATHRDLTEMKGVELRFYSDWFEVAKSARDQIGSSDVAIVTSFCPDGIVASEMVCSSNATLKVFYDLDTPVTLESMIAGNVPGYIGRTGFSDFDLVLSFTGGPSLKALARLLGARRVAPLYGSVDFEAHHPVPGIERFSSDFSYLGTYAEDRQGSLEKLFLEPARRAPSWRFLIGGSKYPQDFPWARNIWFVRHVPPLLHPQFYCSSRMTLNITRRAMALTGFCPSGRLFEAAACGVPIVSDLWEGIEGFFEPGAEILVAGDSDDILRALELTDAELSRIANAARERTRAEHTADRRALELERYCELALQSLSITDQFMEFGPSSGAIMEM